MGEGEAKVGVVVGGKVSEVWRVGWWTVRAALLRAYMDRAREFRLLGDTWLVLEQISRVAWYHGRQSPGHSLYAVCSEAWIAEQVGCRRETVSAHVQRLEALGLVAITHRRKVDGEWQTNLYRLGARVWAALTALVKKPRVAPPPTTQLDQSRRDSYACEEPHTGKGELSRMMRKWYERGTPGAS